MFAFTSMGGKVDDSINKKGRGPYVFRLHGQTYHKIGSLLPEPGAPPKFAQLYIYDTENETENRARALRYMHNIYTFFICVHSFPGAYRPLALSQV